MIGFIVQHEAAVRLGCFLGIFAAMAVWEVVAPRRALTASKPIRWTSNLTLVVLNTVLLRLVFPAAATGMAFLADDRGWGLLNNFEVPAGIALGVAVVALDFTLYVQHVIFHAVPVLWRLHRMHHADLDMDVTVGARFHPIEILLSMLIKFAAIVVLGPGIGAVIVFEVILNATAMFNHGNVRMPEGVDRLLRRLVVTPDMHRVHHSVAPRETNSNFGFALPIWDRMFGTYLAQPEAGHERMTIGIREFRDPSRLTLPWMLALPFLGRATGYAINRVSTDETRP
ncbi:MAG: sterol desaturase family protein [Nitrospirae bacterium]|nr:sterol desaturase family protein [Nitrospirota bacterium]